MLGFQEYATSCLAYVLLGIEPRASCTRQSLCQLSYIPTPVVVMFKENVLSDKVVHMYKPAFARFMQEDHDKFKTSLGYNVVSRLA